MGWGTFIAGRVLRQRAPQRGILEEANSAMDNLLKNATNFELEVLEEIRRLKALGHEVDLNVVRAEVRILRKNRKKMGHALKLAVVQKAQEKTLAGERVNYDEIEREILLAFKPFPWERILKPLFPDYYRAKKFLVKRLKKK